jgi:drug/metabolite transporter (DMT)-like permease
VSRSAVRSRLAPPISPLTLNNIWVLSSLKPVDLTLFKYYLRQYLAVTMNTRDSWQAHQTHNLGVVCVLLGTFLFAAKGIFIKLAYAQGISASPLLMLRMLFALPFYVAVAIWLYRRTGQALTLKQFLPVMGLGLIGYYLSSFLDFWGLELISAGLERLVLYLYPTLVMLLMVFWKKKMPSRREIGALCLAYLGVLLAFIHELQFNDIASHTLLGGFLVFLAACSYAYFVVMTSEKVKQLGALTFTAYGMLSACMGVILHNIIGGHFQLLHQPFNVYSLAFGLAIFSTVLPSFLMNKGIGVVGANKAALLGSLGPPVTLGFSAWILNEPITLLQLLGTAFILMGVGLASQK